MNYLRGPEAVYIFIILANLVTLKIFYDDKLTLFIHPRYLAFTVIMNIISLVIVSMVFVFKTESSPRGVSRQGINYRSGLIVTLLLLIAAGLFLPARPLSASIVNQRNISSNRLDKSVCEDIDPLAPPTEFQDWDQLLDTCDDPLKYQDSKVILEGFVYTEDGYSTEDSFSLARFKVSCCTVDAQPMILTIYHPDWASDFKQREWLHVEGKIIPKRMNGTLKPVIVADKVKRINEPEIPYDFIKF